MILISNIFFLAQAVHFGGEQPILALRAGMDGTTNINHLPLHIHWLMFNKGSPQDEHETCFQRWDLPIFLRSVRKFPAQTLS